ncbi:hypothetical protein [Nocardia brasiliensis]|uniref:hypothetical protein n=1 Tax=Nocardia brasiliensis TaxID=37326 RepID=UPI001895E575|nr:hypothetical protein [Nocardia brasiliensis]MBF6129022.1 hypothetical protein [Nocardia brasiliensis]
MPTASTARDRQESQDSVGRSATDPLRVLGAVVVGVVMLIAAFACLNRMSEWADRYGAIWVYLGFFVYMSIAGRLFWWGFDQLLDRLRAQRGIGR